MKIPPQVSPIVLSLFPTPPHTSNMHYHHVNMAGIVLAHFEVMCIMKTEPLRTYVVQNFQLTFINAEHYREHVH